MFQVLITPIASPTYTRADMIWLLPASSVVGPL